VSYVLTSNAIHGSPTHGTLAFVTDLIVPKT